MKEKSIGRLPKEFRRNIFDLHVESGERWLADLPDLIAEISEKWSLAVGESFPDLSYNYVTPCICADGTNAVLKIGYNEKDSVISSEAKFLTLLDGKGAVKLLGFDEDHCALLLERLMPGESLARLCQTNDEKAALIAIDVMRKICRPPPKNHDFPTLENWISKLQTAAETEFAPRSVAKALNYFEELSDASEQNLLLHGDLHHENILSATRESFLAIDPKGVVGNVGYEIAVFLNNQRRLIRSRQNLRDILAERVEQFAESLEIEPRKLRKWAFVQAVLAAWWGFEDKGTGWEKWTTYADIWEEIGV
ncbi:MAG: phosphotransferase [Acidobacteria bacterium]|nr:phosphotransferase [Acidobacteriota bacterium]